MRQVLIAIDQLANTLLGGWADETVSSRAWREEWTRTVIVLDKVFGKQHCYLSYFSERQRLQLPPEFRP